MYVDSKGLKLQWINSVAFNPFHRDCPKNFCRFFYIFLLHFPIFGPEHDVRLHLVLYKEPLKQHFEK